MKNFQNKKKPINKIITEWKYLAEPAHSNQKIKPHHPYNNKRRDRLTIQIDKQLLYNSFNQEEKR